MTRRSLFALVLGAACCLPSCVLVAKGRDCDEHESRYQFTTDKDGNTIKLDRRSGATWILQKDDTSHTWRRLSDPTGD